MNRSVTASAALDATTSAGTAGEPVSSSAALLPAAAHEEL